MKDNIETKFVSGKPVWLKGRSKEKNVFVGFRVQVHGEDAANAVVRLTASSIYRIFLNGEFLGYGPARGPHGYARVDEWSLKGKCKPGVNTIAVEVAGYNVNSYYLLDQPAFLQAEVMAGARVLASTGGNGAQFEAQALEHRMQKVQRYSFQRPFSEVYRMAPSCDAWRDGGAFNAQELETVDQLRLLARCTPYPEFNILHPLTARLKGTVEFNPDKPVWADRTIKHIGPKLGGYLESELEDIPFYRVQRLEPTTKVAVKKPLREGDRLEMADGDFRTLEFARNNAGFLGATVKCYAPIRLYFAFDELLIDDDVSTTRYCCANVVTYDLTEPGVYNLETFEPYELKYFKVIVEHGACEISNIYFREYVNPTAERASFESSDKALDAIFDAARETFKQNSVDTFTDCAGRERAGWLCDSFYIGRVSADLCGSADMEHVFFENFLLPEKFEHLPEGMLPMCYPSDHNDGAFIPNWAMWFVFQLEEYLYRSGDRAMVDAFKPKVLALIDYFKQFTNDDGLLEKLKGWVFIEWSRANELVQDVNYPSNMTYAAALESIDRIYGMPELKAQADAMRATIREQSFDGEFFVDNAIRRPDGSLELTGERTEVCQYYAFFFGTATIEEFPQLWETLRNDFGPDRKQTKKHPEIYFANAMIGQPMRTELLSRLGLSAQILEESKDYFRKMVETTGTLWEHDSPTASCSHGFASHVERLLFRDVLGIRNIDYVNRKVEVAFSDVPLERCAGVMPIGGDTVKVSWSKEGKAFNYSIETPKDISVSVDLSTIEALGLRPARK